MEDVVVSRFGINLTRVDFECLEEQNRLNDNVINYYLELLHDRSNRNPDLRKIFVFSTQFYQRLVTSGYASVQRWTKKLDIFKNELILFPINIQGQHWILAVVNVCQKVIYIYNSANGDYQKCFNPLVEYLQEEHWNRQKCAWTKFTVDQLQVKGIPKQGNNYDCGMFTLLFAKSITKYACHGNIDFDQKNIPNLRKKMLWEIYHGQLLP